MTERKFTRADIIDELERLYLQANNDEIGYEDFSRILKESKILRQLVTCVKDSKTYRLKYTAMEYLNNFNIGQCEKLHKENKAIKSKLSEIREKIKKLHNSQMICPGFPCNECNYNPHKIRKKLEAILKETE